MASTSVWDCLSWGRQHLTQRSGGHYRDTHRPALLGWLVTNCQLSQICEHYWRITDLMSKNGDLKGADPQPPVLGRARGTQELQHADRKVRSEG